MRQLTTNALIAILILSFPAGLFFVYSPDKSNPAPVPVAVDDSLKLSADVLAEKEREIMTLDQQIAQARNEILQYGKVRGDILKELEMLQAKVDGIIARSERDREESAGPAAGAVIVPVVSEAKVSTKPNPAAQPKVASLAPHKADSQGLGIKIGKPVARLTGNTLDVSFDVHNMANNKKVSGFLWASIEMLSPSGETYHVRAPSGAEVSPTGEIKNLRKAAIFGIERYKRNTFRIDLPDARAGTVVGVKIGVSDRQGQHLRIYDFPEG